MAADHLDQINVLSCSSQEEMSQGAGVIPNALRLAHLRDRWEGLVDDLAYQTSENFDFLATFLCMKNATFLLGG